MFWQDDDGAGEYEGIRGFGVYFVIVQSSFHCYSR